MINNVRSKILKLGTARIHIPLVLKFERDVKLKSQKGMI